MTHLLKPAFTLLLCLLTLTLAFAADPIEGPEECVRCGMDRVFFAHCRAQVSYRDGSRAGTCSIHCAVEEMLKSGKKVAALKVADYASKKLIDPEGATWVVGGKVRGVMTSPAKWAFADHEQAAMFVKTNGGAITPYRQVLDALKLEVKEMDRPAEME